MSNIFTLGDIDNDNFVEQIDLDELYDKKREYDLSKLEIFNKLLNRIHTKIKMTSRQRIDENFCWFVVPEMMIGITKYSHAECVAYLVDKLQSNGFYVKYTHPNLLLISWKHWIPGYVRSEIKKKMNVSIDGYGNVIEDKKKDGVPQLMMNGLSNKPPTMMGSQHDTCESLNKDVKRLGIYSLDLFKNLKD